MSDSAEALAHQANSRNVTIEITNNTDYFCLLDPKVFLESGHCHSPPQPIVRPWKTEVCNFSKNATESKGAVGVLTYDVFMKGKQEAQEKIALMFSVPYDYNFYENWAAVGIYKQDQACDESLYKDMYYEEQKNFKREKAKGCCISHSSDQIQVMCVMSPMGRAIMKVEMWQKSAFPEF